MLASEGAIVAMGMGGGGGGLAQQASHAVHEARSVIYPCFGGGYPVFSVKIDEVWS